MIETISVSVEEFVQEVGVTIEAIAEELEQDLITDLDYFWQEWIEPMLERDREEGENPFREWIDDSEMMLTPYVSPSPSRQTACMGCRHYHGHVYGGNLMVCGMHPYGWDDPSCPDWEGEAEP